MLTVDVDVGLPEHGDGRWRFRGSSGLVRGLAVALDPGLGQRLFIGGSRSLLTLGCWRGRRHVGRITGGRWLNWAIGRRLAMGGSERADDVAGGLLVEAVELGAERDGGGGRTGVSHSPLGINAPCLAELGNGPVADQDRRDIEMLPGTQYRLQSGGELRSRLGEQGECADPFAIVGAIESGSAQLMSVGQSAFVKEARAIDEFGLEATQRGWQVSDHVYPAWQDEVIAGWSDQRLQVVFGDNDLDEVLIQAAGFVVADQADSEVSGYVGGGRAGKSEHADRRQIEVNLVVSVRIDANDEASRLMFVWGTGS
jgi:hypothetical protein